MTRGRKPYLFKTKEISVSIPVDLLDTIDNSLYDPFTKKVRYASRSALIVKLLKRYLKEEEL